ncbi:MAG: EAL domain-containing protein [Desulfosalsimonas sp.]|uniref:sensor domain-containing protein n=1 Tax=Desulfosalsimonas sp. TaxID=3073848 RepID=UPI003970D1A4
MDELNKAMDLTVGERLEAISRNAMEALELCASLGDYQTSVTKFKNRKDILERSLQGLRQMVAIEFYAFYAVNEAHFDIALEHLDDPGRADYVDRTVEDLIDRGAVALAFREKRTQTVRSHDGKYQVLIHAAATTSKIYGVFFCFVKARALEKGIVDKITTIIIKATGYALENFELYQLIRQKNEELVEKNLQVSKSEILYRNTFENTGNPTIVVDQKGTIVHVNSEFAAFSGWEREALSGRRNIAEFLACEGRTGFARTLESAEKDHPDVSPEYGFENRNHEHKTVFLKISPLGLENQYIVSFADITPIKDAEKQLQFQAFHDPLTRLPNRILFRDRLKQAIKKKKRYPDYNYAIVFIDLDRFKSINDTMGHNVGDDLLVKVGQRLASSVRELDTVARFGGDEFLLLLEDVQDQNCCDIVVRRILDQFRLPLEVAGHEVVMTLSMGVLISSESQAEHADAIRLADMSMYEAKRQGRNQVIYAHQIQDREIERRLVLENHLQTGIQKGEFFVQYQPLMDLATNRLYGVEALVRWRHPELGIIPPNSFIPIAEETGLIIPLGRKIFEMAFADFAAWKTNFASARDLCLSVNLSVKQMLQSNLAADIQAMARDAALPLENINLEITESLFIDDMERAIKTIHELKTLGISISIDDFGTGYSSLKYLNQFSIDLVKIDKILIDNINGNLTNYNIVASMLELCAKLNLKAMAEGIEDIDQLEKLRGMNCPFGQGYYFAPPRDRQVIEDMLAGDMGSNLDYCL